MTMTVTLTDEPYARMLLSTAEDLLSRSQFTISIVGVPVALDFFPLLRGRLVDKSPTTPYN